MEGVPAAELAEATEVTVRHIKRVRNGDSDGSPELRGRIWDALQKRAD